MQFNFLKCVQTNPVPSLGGHNYKENHQIQPNSTLEMSFKNLFKDPSSAAALNPKLIGCQV